MRSWVETARSVEARAGGRCEYCGMHQALQGATFHVEHIKPRARGGQSDLDNLAWCCPACNLHKSDRTEARDHETGELVPFFNPRLDTWSNHFCWEDFHVAAKTATGRATMVILDMNHPRRVRIRRAEEVFGLFPP
jgi:HNH endonuclease